MTADKKTFRALDADFREGLRNRIQAADLIDKLQNHVMNPVGYPMSQTQVKVALGLLGHVLPQLKAVEHTNAPTREPTREELIAKLTAIHSRAATSTEQRGTNGAGTADGKTEVRH